MKTMTYENVLEVIAMTVNLSVVSETYGNHQTYCDMSDAQDAENYEQLKDREVIWMSVENNELAITIA